MELFNPSLRESFFRRESPVLPPQVHYHLYRLMIDIGNGFLDCYRGRIFYREGNYRVDLRRSSLVFPPHSPLTVITDSGFITLRDDNITVTIFRFKVNDRFRGSRLVINDLYSFTCHLVYRLRIDDTYYHRTAKGEEVLTVEKDKYTLIGHQTTEGVITFTLSGRTVAKEDIIIEVDKITYHLKNSTARWERVYRAVTDETTVKFPPSLSYSRDDFEKLINSVEGWSVLGKILYQSPETVMERRMIRRPSR